MFWPDYWQPNHTMFNLNKASMIWELIGLDFVDMMEQESGQLLVDRTRSRQALEAELPCDILHVQLVQSLICDILLVKTNNSDFTITVGEMLVINKYVV